MKKEAQTKKKEKHVISKPKFAFVRVLIRGNAPYVQNKFSKKAKEQMKVTQEAGQVAKKGKKKEPKNFLDCYENSIHRSDKGWCGIPAGAFRAAMISACKMVNFAMTRAKLSIFVMADGFDKDDGTPLIKITKGKPEYCEHAVRVQGSADIRARAMWKQGWEAVVSIRYDEDQFALLDIVNLLMRVGLQVGLGEGRPDSRTSCGMGWGTFDLVEK